MHTARPSTLTIFLILALILPALNPPSSHAERKSIILAASRDGWPPFIIVPNGGPDATGIMPDIFKEVCARAGYDVDIRFFPEKRARMLLSQGLIDVYPKSPKWVDDPSAYLWSDPVQEVGDIIVYRRDAPVPLATVQDLMGKNIGTIHGYIYPTLDRHIASGAIRAHTAICTRNLMLMLARKHVDGIVTPRHVADWIIRNEPSLDPAEFAISDQPIDSAPYGFAFAKNKGWEPFIEGLNREMKAMRRDGRMKAILDKYR